MWRLPRQSESCKVRSMQTCLSQRAMTQVAHELVVILVAMQLVLCGTRVVCRNEAAAPSAQLLHVTQLHRCGWKRQRALRRACDASGVCSGSYPHILNRRSYKSTHRDQRSDPLGLQRVR